MAFLVLASETVGFCLITIVFGLMGYNAAKRGRVSAYVFMILMIAIDLMAVLGLLRISSSGLRIPQIVSLILVIVFTILIWTTKKKN